MKSIAVFAPSGQYEVKIGRGLLPTVGREVSACTRAKRCVLVSGENVFPLYGNIVLESLCSAGLEAYPIVFPAGENTKCLQCYGELLEFLAGHTLTMINFFEPWCPPCIAELPDLEKLYETYAPEGFQILGVFSTEEGTAEVVSDAALSYPVLRYVPEFDPFQTGYVPTTIFVDGSGRIVGETKIGSNSYAGWEAIVKDLMG